MSAVSRTHSNVHINVCLYAPCSTASRLYICLHIAVRHTSSDGQKQSMGGESVHDKMLDYATQLSDNYQDAPIFNIIHLFVNHEPTPRHAMSCHPVPRQAECR